MYLQEDTPRKPARFQQVALHILAHVYSGLWQRTVYYFSSFSKATENLHQEPETGP